MTLSQRVGVVLAREGLTGVLRRVGRRVAGDPAARARASDRQADQSMMAEAKAEYGRLTAAFSERTAGLGDEDLKR